MSGQDRLAGLLAASAGVVRIFDDAARKRLLPAMSKGQRGVAAALRGEAAAVAVRSRGGRAGRAASVSSSVLRGDRVGTRGYGVQLTVGLNCANMPFGFFFHSQTWRS